MKKNILVPFDGSKNALEALHVAIGLAKALQEKLVVLNVQPEFKTPNVKRFFSEEDVLEYQNQLFHEVTDSIEQELKNSGLDYEIRLRVGDVKEQILLEATPSDEFNESGCSVYGVRMIVMGSRGMNPMLGGILGSVSYGIVNAAPCPITIVPFSCE
jgi:nucleotide-binding universal stress UspA family protein